MSGTLVQRRNIYVKVNIVKSQKNVYATQKNVN